MDIAKNKNPRRLGYWFSKDFQVHTLGFVFLFGNNKHFGKSLETFGSWIFFLGFFITISWYGFSYWFLVVLNVFHQCFVDSNNPKFNKRCFIKEGLQKHFCIIGLVSCAPKRNPKARVYGLKIYSLERNPRLWLDSWQCLETFTKIISSNTVGICLKRQWLKILFLSEKWGRQAAANVVKSRWKGRDKFRAQLNMNEALNTIWIYLKGQRVKIVLLV